MNNKYTKSPNSLKFKFTNIKKGLLFFLIMALSSGAVYSQCAMSGTYTINSALPTNVSTSGTNFNSFNDLATNLTTCGVSGHVTVNVVVGSGPYTEQVNFTSISGLGASATITINGNDETITFSTNTTDRHVIRLTSLQYFTLRNLNIVKAGTETQFMGVHILNSGSFITIDSVDINIAGNTSALAGGIIASGSTTSILSAGNYNNLTITNNSVIGGGYGISVYGLSATSQSANVVLANNNLSQHNSNAIYLRETIGVVVSENTIQISGGNGIQLAQSANANALIEKNRISANSTVTLGTLRGIYVFGNNGSNHNIINNVIHNMNVTGANVYGLVGRAPANYYNNTVILDDQAATGGNSFGYFDDGSSAASVIRNNIFYVTRSGTGDKAGLSFTSTSTSTSNNNVFYIPNGNIGIKGTTSYATLAAWQTGTGQDLNSFSVNPNFVSTATPIPTNGVINNQGVALAVVTEDITGAPRGANPDPGAYEFTPAADDVALTEVVIPSTPFCGDSLDVMFDLSNAGGNVVNSATITFTINGGTSVVTNLTGLNLTSGSSTTVTAGRIPVSPNTYYSIEGIVSNPNGTTDINNVNDTARLNNWRTGFAGTYTVDPASAATAINYQSIQAVANELTQYGVCDDVIINVVPGAGPFNSQITFDTIPGTSDTSQVIVNGNGNTISFNTTAATDHVLRLSGVQYITIDSFNIVSTHATNGRGIWITNDASNLTIQNSTIEVAMTNNSSSSFGIIASGNNWLLDGTESTNINIIGNFVKGGYSGIQITGDHWTNPITNALIADNTIQDFYGYGVYLSYTGNATVSRNDISRPLRTNSGSDSQTPAGIIAPAGNSGYLIEKNEIHGLFTNMPGTELTKLARGIYLSGTTTAPSSGDIVNNLMYDFNNTGSQYGIQNNSTTGPVNIYHNTIVFDDQTTTTTTVNTAAIYLSNSSAQNNIDIKNNLLYITRASNGTMRLIDVSNSSTSFNSNHNILFISSQSGNTEIGRYGSSYTDLIAWRSGTGKDLNSIFADPVFATGLYKPTYPYVDNVGTPVGILDDIVDSIRSTVTPDAGAYEFTLPPLNNDGTVTAVLSPENNDCGVTDQQVEVVIQNLGPFSISNFNVSADISGIVNTTLSTNYAGPLDPNDSDTVVIGSINTTPGGSLSIKAYTSVPLDINNVNDTMTVTVNINQRPTINAGQDVLICEGEDATLTATGASSYSWSHGATGASVVVSPTINTIYIVTGTLNGCSNSDTVAVFVNPAPAIDILTRPTELCNDLDHFVLQGTPAGGMFSGPGVTNDTLFISDAIAAVGVNNPFYVTFSYTSGNCTAVDSFLTEITVCTNINDPEVVKGIEIYPNPFINEINIKTELIITDEIRMFSASGAAIEIETITIGNNIKIIPKNISSGIYFVRLRSDDRIEFIKIMKM